MPLRDALAAALTNQYAEIWTEGGPWLTTPKTGGLLADHVLSDPAFREALVEAVEGAMKQESHDWPLARSIVARMLGDEP